MTVTWVLGRIAAYERSLPHFPIHVTLPASRDWIKGAYDLHEL
ncbi:hypothetical protein [Paenibacillus senegalimassiliensis]|nr:hypothetical protein [Paenibacillus senegalimassiliensis]